MLFELRKLVLKRFLNDDLFGLLTAVCLFKLGSVILFKVLTVIILLVGIATATLFGTGRNRELLSLCGFFFGLLP